MRTKIRKVIKAAIQPLRIVGKQGQATLQPTIAAALDGAGFEADLEDK